MVVKVGKYSWDGPYSYTITEDGETYDDMISPHDRANLLSDLSIEDFVNNTWQIDQTTPEDNADFTEFWRQVREHERTHNFRI